MMNNTNQPFVNSTVRNDTELKDTKHGPGAMKPVDLKKYQSNLLKHTTPVNKQKPTPVHIYGIGDVPFQIEYDIGNYITSFCRLG